MIKRILLGLPPTLPGVCRTWGSSAKRPQRSIFHRLFVHSWAMGLQIRKKLSLPGPLLAINAPSPTGAWPACTVPASASPTGSWPTGCASTIGWCSRRRNDWRRAGRSPAVDRAQASPGWHLIKQVSVRLLTRRNLTSRGNTEPPSSGVTPRRRGPDSLYAPLTCNGASQGPSRRSMVGSQKALVLPSVASGHRATGCVKNAKHREIH